MKQGFYSSVHRDGQPAADVASPPIATSDLVCRFESLGQSCEFGFVQRRAGAEPMGLLRFAGMPFDQLIRALHTEFVDLDDPKQLEVFVTDGEYRVKLPALGLGYHTYLSENEINLHHLVRVERRKVRVLARQLVSDLRGGRKIFVYQQREGPQPRSRDALADALSRYDAPLLWVEAADPDHPPGTVERTAARVVRGFVRLAPVGAVHAPDMESWTAVCRAAFRLCFPPLSPGEVEPGRSHRRIDFGAGGNALRYVREGWSQPEPRFTWAVGARSRLTLPRPDMDEALLTLSVAPFVHLPECPAQRLSVIVNGCDVAAYSLQGEAQLHCVIPRAAVARHDMLSIAFHHPDAAAPSRFAGGSGDTRELAVLFKSLAIHPL